MYAKLSLIIEREMMKKYLMLLLLGLSPVQASQTDSDHIFEDQTVCRQVLLSSCEENKETLLKINLNNIFDAYLESSHDNIKNLKILSQNEIDDNGPYKFAQKLLATQFYNIKDFRALFESWKEGHDSSKETMVQTLLIRRFEELGLRNDKNQKKRRGDPQEQNLSRYFSLPTDPESYKTLTPDLKLCVDIMVDHYQFLNMMTVMMLTTLDMTALKKKTENLLRASVSLHRLIRDGFYDLGHPDEALYTSSTDASVKTDYDFYSYYFEKTEETSIHSYSSFHKETISVLLTPHERDIIENHHSSMPDLPYPSFLKKKTKSPDALPAPSKSTSKKEAQSNAVKSWLSEESQKPARDHEPPVQKTQGNPLEKKTKKKLPPTKSTPDQQRGTAPGQQRNEIISSPEGPLSKKLKEKGDTPFAALKTHHQNILDDIFDNQKLSDVTFKKFTTLWEALGGVIPKKKGGGSHRPLVFNNKTVGGTYVPHGGHAYGKKSIKSLREALKKIGYAR